MSLIELLAIFWCFAGLIVGVVIGAHYSWWWAVLGAPLGLVAGLVVHSLVMLPAVLYLRFQSRKVKPEQK
jgi:fatty acid desaturase